jgi:alpha-D-xyloside xylohydrolase
VPRNSTRCLLATTTRLWQVAHDAARQGRPVLRPLVLAFPDDPVAGAVDDAFLLGADVLVVPVFDDGPGPVRRRFYVPAGGWTDLLTGERFDGACHVEREVGLETIPVLVRDGAWLPRVAVGDEVATTDDLLGVPWELHVHGAPETVCGSSSASTAPRCGSR